MSNSSPTKPPSSLHVKVTPTKTYRSLPPHILQMKEEASLNATLKPLYEQSKVRKVILKHGNNKESMLTFVPQIVNKAWFLRSASRNGGLYDQVEFMSENKVDPSTQEPAGLTVLLDTLCKKYPKSFESYVNSRNLTNVPPRLDIHSSLAVMNDCKLTGAQMRKIDQHTQHHSNRRLFSPEYKLTELFNEAPTPRITVEKVSIPFAERDECDDEEENRHELEETVTLMTHNVGENLQAHVLRYLNTKIGTNLPLDYEISKKIGVGVLQLVGTDHGAGFSQFLLQTLLLSSSQRRAINKANFGSLHIPIAVARCKRESDAIDMTVDVMREGINLMNGSQLLGIRNEKGNFIHAEFVPVKATNIVLEQINGKDYKIAYDTTNGEITTRNYVNAAKGVLIPIVRKFVVAVVGDLSAVMYIQNRKSMSPHECILCEKKKVSGVEKAVEKKRI